MALPIEHEVRMTEAGQTTHRCRTPGCGHKLLDVRDDPRNYGQLRVQCRRCRQFTTVYLGGYQRRDGDEAGRDGART